MSDKEIDCDGTDEVVCPHCGYEFRESWEFFLGSDNLTIECDGCTKQFQCIERTAYTSSKIEKEQPHE